MDRTHAHFSRRLLRERAGSRTEVNREEGHTQAAGRTSHSMTDAEAMEVLGRLHGGDRRSTFAQALFPYDPTKYRSRGEWAKAVGTRVAHDIRTDPLLCQRMHALGYEPHRQGYTLEQRIELIKFYK